MCVCVCVCVCHDREDTSRNVYVYDGFKFKGSFLVKWFSVKGLTLGADVQVYLVLSHALVQLPVN